MTKTNENSAGEAQGEAPQPSEHKHALSNLLAVIHRDGGHYESDHGTTKAAEDAERIVLDLRTRPETGAHPSQDARQFYEQWRSKKYGGNTQPWPYSVHAEVCEFAEAHARAEVESLRGQLARLSEDFQSWLKKYESGELASGSTPSPDPQEEK